MKRGVVIGVVIFLVLVLLGGGVFLYWNSRDNGSEAEISQSADWCAGLGEAYATMLAGMNASGDEALAGDLASTFSEMAIGDVTRQKTALSLLGVDISEQELCAYKRAEISKQGASNSQENEVSALVEAVDLEPYLSPERSSMVSEWMKKVALDDLAKKEVAPTSAKILICAESNENRISEPFSGKRICEPTGDEDAIASADVWPDIEQFGGKWEGCPFEISRTPSVVEKNGNRVGGHIEKIRYCATLPTGTVVTCTLNGCSYSLSNITQ